MLIFHPLSNSIGAWLSLVERCVRDAEVAGSNPVVPTIDYLFRHEAEIFYWSFFTGCDPVM